MVNLDLNGLGNTQLILSIDDKNRSRKVDFNLDKGCKSKGYVDGIELS
jgi:hypothetical protein